MSDNREIVNKGWHGMEQMLDVEMPVQSNKRRVVWFAFGLALLMAILLWSLLSPSTTQTQHGAFADDTSVDESQIAQREEPNSSVTVSAIGDNQNDDLAATTIESESTLQQPLNQASLTHSTNSINTSTTPSSSRSNTLKPFTLNHPSSPNTEYDGTRFYAKNTHDNYNTNNLHGNESQLGVNIKGGGKIIPTAIGQELVVRRGLQILPHNGFTDFGISFVLRSPSLISPRVEVIKNKLKSTINIGLEAGKFTNAPVSMAGIGLGYTLPIEDKVSLISKISYHKSFYKIGNDDLFDSNSSVPSMDISLGGAPELDTTGASNANSILSSTMSMVKLSFMSAFNFNENIAFYGGVTGANSFGRMASDQFSSGRVTTEPLQNYNQWLFGYTTGFQLTYSKIGLNLEYSRLSRNAIPGSEFDDSRQFVQLGLQYRL